LKKAAYDYEALEERGKERANRFFDLFFRAYKKHPKEAARVRVDFVEGRITYEEAIKRLSKLARN